MIQDIKFLYDNEKIDDYIYGKLDSFIDLLFNEKRLTGSKYYDDAIGEMCKWACFKTEKNYVPPKDDVVINKIVSEIQKEVKEENTIVSKNKKIGRNEPCPCGSGRKYKSCCYAKDQNTEKIVTNKIEDKYNLLEKYPIKSELFLETYSDAAIKVDIPVYKALSHRAIPFFVKRDFEQERIGKIHYLNEALTLFNNKCEEEGIKTFWEFDKKYMVHYYSQEWVLDLIGLIKNNDTKDILNIKILAEETLEKYSDN